MAARVAIGAAERARDEAADDRDDQRHAEAHRLAEPAGDEQGRERADIGRARTRSALAAELSSFVRRSRVER